MLSWASLAVHSGYVPPSRFLFFALWSCIRSSHRPGPMIHYLPGDRWHVTHKERLIQVVKPHVRKCLLCWKSWSCNELWHMSHMTCQQPKIHTLGSLNNIRAVQSLGSFNSSGGRQFISICCSRAVFSSGLVEWSQHGMLWILLVDLTIHADKAHFKMLEVSLSCRVKCQMAAQMDRLPLRTKERLPVSEKDGNWESMVY